MIDVRETMFDQCKAVFATHLADIQVPAGHVLFNASRPIFGNRLDYDEWCFGRFYTTLSPQDDHAEYSIKENLDLDARIVILITPEEAAEIVLLGHRYAHKYREYSLEDRVKMLLPMISKKQHLPYPEALALLDAVRQLADKAA